MSGLIGSIGSLFGGSAAKTDRKNELQGIGNLNNVFNFGMKGAAGEMGAGSALQGQAGDYYSKLLSGNRTAALSAIAPVANTAATQSDAAKRQIATSGTARGGGVNATGQQLDTQRRSAVDDALNRAKAAAAGGAAQLGSTQVSQAANLLGIGSNAAANEADISSQSRALSQKLHDEKVNAAADLAGGIVDSIFGIATGQGVGGVADTLNKIG